MLPFLKNKQKSVAGVIVQSRKPDEGAEKQDDSPSDSDVMGAAKEMMEAVKAGDVRRLADALYLVQELHLKDIGQEHPSRGSDGAEDNSFAGRNQAAAKGQE